MRGEVRRWSQADLADVPGVSRHSVNAIEQGVSIGACRGRSRSSASSICPSRTSSRPDPTPTHTSDRQYHSRPSHRPVCRNYSTGMQRSVTSPTSYGVEPSDRLRSVSGVRPGSGDGRLRVVRDGRSERKLALHCAPPRGALTTPKYRRALPIASAMTGHNHGCSSGVR